MRKLLCLGLFLLMIAGAVEASTSAWVYANNPTAQSYSPAAAYAYNPAGAITITHGTAGAYNVRFHGLAPLVHGRGNVQVTPQGVGPPPTICRVGAWTKVGNDVIVNVRCVALSGANTNSYYTVLFTFN